nr:PREDICTED: methyltransferase-like protein 23 isoform X2 [Rhinolophus sinicus]
MLGRSGLPNSRLTAGSLQRPLPVASLPTARRLSAVGFRLARGGFTCSLICLALGLFFSPCGRFVARGVLFPFLPSGFSDPTGPAEDHVTSGKRPQPAQGPAGARSLAARLPLLLRALQGATESPLSERELRGHVVRTQRFRFSEEPGLGADGAVLEVCVPQVLHLQYGMYVWPCAVVLAQYLWFHRRCLPGKAVLEIGAGVSLPGIIAAKCGAEVTLSDSSELPHCLEICQKSCQMNDLPQVHVVGLTWGHVSQDLLALPSQDIILASDVFFEPEDFEDILTTVYFLMQKNPKAQLWSTYQC